MRVVARVCVLSLRASTACRARPRGVLPAAAEARFRRPRGWPAVRTGRGAAVAGRGRARHGRRRRRRRAPRRRTTTAADSSLSCQLTPAAVPPTTTGPSRGPASCDLPWYSRHGYFTLTRVAAQLFANLGTKRRRGASQSSLVGRRNGRVAPPFTSPRPVGEEVRGLSELSNTSLISQSCSRRRAWAAADRHRCSSSHFRH